MGTFGCSQFGSLSISFFNCFCVLNQIIGFSLIDLQHRIEFAEFVEIIIPIQDVRCPSSEPCTELLLDASV